LRIEKNLLHRPVELADLIGNWPIINCLFNYMLISMMKALRGDYPGLWQVRPKLVRGPSANLARARLVACHGTDGLDRVIRDAGNSVFCMNPRVEPLLPQRSATKRDKESYA
jgi:hypothetical protein